MVENKIKIVHVAQAAGGVDRYIRMLLKYLNKNEFDNILICSQDFNEKNYLNLVSSFEQINMMRKIGINDLNNIIRVRKLLKKYNPDIVYAHSSKAGAIARIANIGLNSCCIYNPHGWSFNMRCSSHKKNLYIIIEKIAALFCKKIICISNEEEKAALNKKICKKKKMQVIYNGVDIDDYLNSTHSEISREDLNIPQDAFVVGMVGRISPQKAPDVFIEAAKYIKEKIPSAQFIIVGNGEQEEEIREIAEKNGILKSLYITGWVENPTSYIELFDVACLLSRWEGFGLVLPEYMMTGKPIVASRVDAIPEIIRNEENGMLVDVDDAIGVSRAVYELYKNQAIREKLVSQGLKDAEDRFNAKRVAKEHKILFEKLLGD